MTRATRGLLLDVFGTCVDWRAGVARALAQAAEREGLGPIDAGAVADAWRGRYQPQLETVRCGGRPWVDLDVLHRESLDDVLAGTPLEALGPGERDALTRAWHRLDPWPDVPAGLRRLRRDHVVAACSNGHVALVAELSRHGGLTWDAVLGAEPARAYKPAAAVYLHALDALGLRPEEATMVAAHRSDMEAAAACGLCTAFVRRPLEHGPQGHVEEPPEAVDIVVDGLDELADRLGS